MAKIMGSEAVGSHFLKKMMEKKRKQVCGDQVMSLQHLFKSLYLQLFED